MKIPNSGLRLWCVFLSLARIVSEDSQRCTPRLDSYISLARIVSEDSQPEAWHSARKRKSSKDS